MPLPCIPRFLPGTLAPPRPPLQLTYALSQRRVQFVRCSEKRYLPVRYVEVAGNDLVLRPHNPASPIEVISINHEHIVDSLIVD